MNQDIEKVERKYSDLIDFNAVKNKTELDAVLLIPLSFLKEEQQTVLKKPFLERIVKESFARLSKKVTKRLKRFQERIGDKDMRIVIGSIIHLFNSAHADLAHNPLRQFNLAKAAYSLRECAARLWPFFQSYIDYRAIKEKIRTENEQLALLEEWLRPLFGQRIVKNIQLYWRDVWSEAPRKKFTEIDIIAWLYLGNGFYDIFLFEVKDTKTKKRSRVLKELHRANSWIIQAFLNRRGSQHLPKTIDFLKEIRYIRYVRQYYVNWRQMKICFVKFKEIEPVKAGIIESIKELFATPIEFEKCENLLKLRNKSFLFRYLTGFGPMV